MTCRRPAPTQRAAVFITAVWAFGIVVITAGLIGFQGKSADGARVGLVADRRVCSWPAGLFVERRRRRAGRPALHIQRRPVAIALFVGFVIAYAQTAALFQVPIYFQLVLGYGPVLSVIATIPFMVALAVAGPVAGLLLARFSPADPDRRRDPGRRARQHRHRRDPAARAPATSGSRSRSC